VSSLSADSQAPTHIPTTVTLVVDICRGWILRNDSSGACSVIAR
jgi:hypothetical protein